MKTGLSIRQLHITDKDNIFKVCEEQLKRNAEKIIDYLKAVAKYHGHIGEFFSNQASTDRIFFDTQKKDAVHWEITLKEVSNVLKSFTILKAFQLKFKDWHAETSEQSFKEVKNIAHFFFYPVKNTSLWTKFWGEEVVKMEAAKYSDEQIKEVYKLIMGGFCFKIVGLSNRKFGNSTQTKPEFINKEKVFTTILHTYSLEAFNQYCVGKVQEVGRNHFNIITYEVTKDLREKNSHKKSTKNKKKNENSLFEEKIDNDPFCRLIKDASNIALQTILDLQKEADVIHTMREKRIHCLIHENAHPSLESAVTSSILVSEYLPNYNMTTSTSCAYSTTTTTTTPYVPAKSPTQPIALPTASDLGYQSNSASPSPTPQKSVSAPSTPIKHKKIHTPRVTRIKEKPADSSARSIKSSSSFFQSEERESLPGENLKNAQPSGTG